MLSIQRRTVYLLMLICIGQVLLISAQVQSKAGVPLLEALAVGGFSGVQRTTTGLADVVHNVWAHYFALRGAAIENDQLRRQLIEKEGLIQSQQALVSRMQTLEAALSLQQSAVVQTVTARVIAGSPSPDTMTVTIDVGSANGVEADMAVIAANGIVGRVIEHPKARTAQVQLLIDRNASAAVRFERTGAGGGNAVGRADDPPLRLEQIPNLSDVKVGDRVLTSGLDGIYPPGFTIGSVERVDLSNAALRVVTVRPAVDFSLLDIVLVVITRPVTAAK
jgi:rod shape-determining protein MreC